MPATREAQPWQRRQAKALGHRNVHCGSVTFAQRFGSAININPHHHVLAPDGVFTVEDDGSLRFVELPPPTDDEVEKVARGVMRRVRRLLSRMEDDGALSADEDEGALSTSLIEALAPRSQGRAPNPGANRLPVQISAFLRERQQCGPASASGGHQQPGCPLQTWWPATCSSTPPKIPRLWSVAALRGQKPHNQSPKRSFFSES